MSAGITAWLDEAQAKADAATKAPWVVYPNNTSVSYIEQSQRDGSVIGGGHVADASPDDAAFIADARTRFPQAIAALRAVHKPEVDEGTDWLGGKRTHDVEGADPGNQEYMDHLNRVLSAAYPDGFRWGPVLLAIVLDRGVRATEDAAAIAAALEVQP